MHLGGTAVQGRPTADAATWVDAQAAQEIRKESAVTDEECDWRPRVENVLYESRVNCRRCSQGEGGDGKGRRRGRVGRVDGDDVDGKVVTPGPAIENSKQRERQKRVLTTDGG